MTRPEQALRAFNTIDFDWARHVKSVWHDSPFDIEALNANERQSVLHRLDLLQQTEQLSSPLGLIIQGLPGAGKTHLLSVVRRQAIARGLGFVLVDMTDIRNFWETVLEGYISSLQEDHTDGTQQFQLKQLVEHLVAWTGHTVSSTKMAQLSLNSLKNANQKILTKMARSHRQKVMRFQDIIRALIFLHADDFMISGVGYSYLQGMEIEADEKSAFGFQAASMKLSDIVEGLSWIMGLKGSTVLALDQLDAIVAQHHYITENAIPADLTNEQRVSKAIIEAIGGGLMALRDITTRTLTLVSCLPVTWEILARSAVQSVRDRFLSNTFLTASSRQAVVEQLIAVRLQPAYEAANLDPPYPTWPFQDDFLTEAAQLGKSPRQILQRCSQHRDQCIANGEVVELCSFSSDSPSPLPTSDFAEIEAAFDRAKQQVDIYAAVDEAHEDDILGQWIKTASACLVEENPTADSIDVRSEDRFPGDRTSPQLHARIRIIYRDQSDREKHLCFRALQRSHHSAYRSRLKAAMTTSGIDHALSFRRLMLIRTREQPSGTVTQRLTRQAMEAGGLFAYPEPDDLRVLGALHVLRSQHLPQFEDWLRQRRPVSQLAFMQDTVTWLFSDVSVTPPGSSTPVQDPPVADSVELGVAIPLEAPSPNNGYPPLITPPLVQPSMSTALMPTRSIPVGKRVMGRQQQGGDITLPLEALTKHVIVLAGSGAGKTVLVRRLIEEAALQGIPAIVIDGANDLARMGDRWPVTPESWARQDRVKAERYHQQTDVVVWTPGRSAGRPLNLNPLPDFRALQQDPDELNQAIDMARDSLQAVVASGSTASARLKQGILRHALEYFASTGGATLDELIELLSDLPDEAAGAITKASRRAQEMADLLSAERVNNPLLRQKGEPLDPAMLLGTDRASAATRLSIINFIGLPGLAQQQQFLNQLAMTLFTWIKKNPAPADQPLRGLLVLDEAKDFVPSRHTTPCKSSLNRLAAQARKYGLGLVFATQAPKSIDHNIIANCSTQFYGRANSPAAIDVVQDQLRQRGRPGDDIARLGRGQFYVASESITPPLKVSTPLCLSHHPASPLDEGGVLQRANSTSAHQPTSSTYG